MKDEEQTGILQRAAVLPEPTRPEGLPVPVHEVLRPPGHDFTRVPAHAAAPEVIQTCPLAPRRCPFGGACHTCPARVQAKLTIGESDDKYEQEADRVADMVMSMPEPRMQRQAESEEDEEEEAVRAKPLAGQITPLVQRQVEPEEEEEEEEPVQAQAAPGRTPAVTPTLQVQIDALRGGGEPLPASDRAFFEPRFGYDFSQVRVHTHARAAEAAQELKARAFTVGRDLAFGLGQYAPGTGEGQKLLAHELAHVVQQSSSSITRIQRVPITKDWAKNLDDNELKKGIKTVRSALLRILDILKPKRSERKKLKELKPSERKRLEGIYQELHVNLTILRTEALSRFTFFAGLQPYSSSEQAMEALDFARKESGKRVVEKPACTNRGQDVDKYTGETAAPSKVVGNKAVSGKCGPAWCAYFVRWCLNQAGVSNGLNGGARSVRDWGEEKGWYHEITTVEPVSGDIFYMLPDVNTTSTHPCDKMSLCPNTGMGGGHVGFVLSVSGSAITTIEGNTHGESKDNDGVHEWKRNLADLDGVLRIQPQPSPKKRSGKGIRRSK